ncbi:hypothetical protein [Streptomyces sp. GbtcB6]|uniref:hypothetical protein n=1 Tax=Streptomyces sp. GbtcB6 TaxID=2824751 RepID=UPI001C301683|nr:hypothetical protein [Streptomyces sp. GbtcB6]
MTNRPPEPPPGQSFSATPKDSARAYQTGGNQTINEHHHYAPRRSLRSALAWSVSGALLVALGAVVGVDLWERHTTATDAAKDAGPVADGKAPTGSPTASPSPGASSPRPSSTPTSVGKVAKGADTETSAAVATPSGPPTDGTLTCSGWKTTDVGDIQIERCGRVVGDDLYISARWRTTSGSARADIYVWLEDSNKQVVYPGASAEHGVPSYNAEAWPTPHTARQWAEYKVQGALVHGSEYTVCVSVMPRGAAGPDIASTNVAGYTEPVTYF